MMGLFSTPVQELKNANLRDASGRQLGQILEIVVKQDGSEAGFVMSNEQGQGYDYVPLYQISMRGDQLIAEDQANIQSVTPDELEQQNFNRIPDTQRPLSDYVQFAELQQ